MDVFKKQFNLIDFDLGPAVQMEYKTALAHASARTRTVAIGTTVQRLCGAMTDKAVTGRKFAPRVRRMRIIQGFSG